MTLHGHKGATRRAKQRAKDERRAKDGKPARKPSGASKGRKR